MRKLSSLACIASAFALTQMAVAADLPVKAPPYRAPVVAPYTWTGCFVGGNVGGLWAHKEWIDNTPGGGVIGQPLGSHDADSWLGGVQVGCDYQFAGGWVIGVQGDYDWTDAKGTNADLLVAPIGSATDQTKIKSLASVTGRLGYAWDRFLGYVRGGGAWARDDYSIFYVDGLETANETRSGWTVGVGGEYAFTNWASGFAEYDYYDFGTRTIPFSGGTVADIKEHANVVKVGLNLRWGLWR